jgi:hypothetical protein
MRSTGTRPAAIRAQGLGRRFNGVIASGEIYGFLGRRRGEGPGPCMHHRAAPPRCLGSRSEDRRRSEGRGRAPEGDTAAD